jgi:hypothetical protein
MLIGAELQLSGGRHDQLKSNISLQNRLFLITQPQFRSALWRAEKLSTNFVFRSFLSAHCL